MNGNTVMFILAMALLASFVFLLIISTLENERMIHEVLESDPTEAIIYEYKNG